MPDNHSAKPVVFASYGQCARCKGKGFRIHWSSCLTAYRCRLCVACSEEDIMRHIRYCRRELTRWRKKVTDHEKNHIFMATRKNCAEEVDRLEWAKSTLYLKLDLYVDFAKELIQAREDPKEAVKDYNICQNEWRGDALKDAEKAES